MFSYAYSGDIRGVESFLVKIEVDIADGLPGFDIVGSVSNEVREARDRVRVAMRNSGYSIPVKHMTVNLSPAGIRKSNTGFDLPLALCILQSMDIISPDALSGTFFAGEMMLSGEVRSTPGILPMLLAAKAAGLRRCVVPKANEEEAIIVEGINVYGVRSLNEAVMFLNGALNIEPVGKMSIDEFRSEQRYESDFADVYGQPVAKRGLEIAAAGMHNVLMVGPPGAGKSMLARCLPSILPPLSPDECLEVSSVYSVAGLKRNGHGLITCRPFVTPHHSTTVSALIGGGVIPRPGAVSYADKGVLFLDEFPEFPRHVLESLRQPLEDRKVRVARNADICTFPADFMLVAAMNPCPCGNWPDRGKCRCTDAERTRYIGKISGPLLDRMDICLNAEKIMPSELMNSPENISDTSEVIRNRVLAAHEIQKDRFKDSGILFNSQMGNKEIDKYCRLSPDVGKILETLALKHDMSTRSYFRVLRIARTIADLSERDNIEAEHIIEAVRLKSNYR